MVVVSVANVGERFFLRSRGFAKITARYRASWVLRRRNEREGGGGLCLRASSVGTVPSGKTSFFQAYHWSSVILTVSWPMSQDRTSSFILVLYILMFFMDERGF